MHFIKDPVQPAERSRNTSEHEVEWQRHFIREPVKPAQRSRNTSKHEVDWQGHIIREPIQPAERSRNTYEHEVEWQRHFIREPVKPSQKIKEYIQARSRVTRAHHQRTNPTSRKIKKYLRARSRVTMALRQIAKRKGKMPLTVLKIACLSRKMYMENASANRALLMIKNSTFSLLKCKACFWLEAAFRSRFIRTCTVRTETFNLSKFHRRSDYLNEFKVNHLE